MVIAIQKRIRAIINHAFSTLSKASLLLGLMWINLVRSKRRANFMMDAWLQLTILELLIEGRDTLIPSRQSWLERDWRPLIIVRLICNIRRLESFSIRNLSLIPWFNIVCVLIPAPIAYSCLLLRASRMIHGVQFLRIFEVLITSLRQMLNEIVNFAILLLLKRRIYNLIRFWVLIDRIWLELASTIRWSPFWLGKLSMTIIILLIRKIITNTAIKKFKIAIKITY